jgi:hypothetical protein
MAKPGGPSGRVSDATNDRPAGGGAGRTVGVGKQSGPSRASLARWPDRRYLLGWGVIRR